MVLSDRHVTVKFFTMNRGGTFSVCQHRPPDHPVPLWESTVAARLWGVWLLVREWKYALCPGPLSVWEQAWVWGFLSRRLHSWRHRSNQRMVCHSRVCAPSSFGCFCWFCFTKQEFMKCPHASAWCWQREDTVLPSALPIQHGHHHVFPVGICYHKAIQL